MTWNQSPETRSSEGLELAKIASSRIQIGVEGLLLDLPESTLIQIWIGGRRSTDDEWKCIKGTKFDKQDSTPEGYPEICHEKHPCKLLRQQKPFDRGNGSILPHNGIIYI
ncbi:hypothetical protein LSH36_2772g00009 [Paralvinella palmiformis]|uniref:Uncharacterized protein n=1 Tax=Paralvinella palmiformis TaxID=53620 RepID=A0AAD9IQM6_9ANNE|nr:hypothetical protein LSH36_2772g00009 [Paralvinella palmiformis]